VLCIKGKQVGGGWLTLPVCTAIQIVCPVDQTDATVAPDHTTSQVDVQWSSLGPQATILMTSVGPQNLFWLGLSLICQYNFDNKRSKFNFNRNNSVFIGHSQTE